MLSSVHFSGMAKLSIKGLIESSLGAGHTLDSDHTSLQQFFVIMESVLKHGLKSKYRIHHCFFIIRHGLVINFYTEKFYRVM